MKNLLKLKVIFLVFSIIFASQAIAADRILPLPKPIPDKETKIQIAKKKTIYPKKKPALKKEKVQVVESKEITEIADETKEEIYIYPEKKPLVFQKKVDKAVVKSTILTKKDFKIAKDAFKAIEKRKWNTAIELAKKANDKMIFKLIYWLYLKEPINQASFYDYLTFIKN